MALNLGSKRRVTEKVEHVDGDGKVEELHNRSEDPLLTPAQGEARVIVYLGHTKNLGDYASLRGDVGIELPCAVADVGETYADAASWVCGRLDELFEEALKEED